MLVILNPVRQTDVRDLDRHEAAFVRWQVSDTRNIAQGSDTFSASIRERHHLSGLHEGGEYRFFYLCVPMRGWLSSRHAQNPGNALNGRATVPHRLLLLAVLVGAHEHVA